MKFVSYIRDGETRTGELHDGQIVESSIDGVALYAMMERGELPTPPQYFDYQPLPDAQFAPPVRPSKILAIGRNYAEHAAELKNELPTKPLVFAKYPSCVIANGDAIQWRTDITQQVDWEGELAIVIGKPARFVSEEAAYDYVFGYTIANDISARDLQATEGQWTRAKAQDTFCPLGPCLVTRDELPDPHNLRIQTLVNGETMQDGNTRDMIFNVPYLVHYLSQTFTLYPGDIILTGTPSGVGKAQNPPRFLKHGDIVSVTIEGIGTLTNRCEVLA